MIRFIDKAFIGGQLFTAGMLGQFDAATEAALIAVGDAANYPLPVLISQSYSAVTRSSKNGAGGSPLDTDYVTLASVTLPGGTMNYNGKVVIEQDWKCTSSVSTKNLRIDWGGTWMTGPSLTTSSRAWFTFAVKNANSLAVQTALNGTAFSAGTEVTAAVDTTKDVPIDFRCNWGANVASESIILVGYSVWYYPGNT